MHFSLRLLSQCRHEKHSKRDKWKDPSCFIEFDVANWMCTHIALDIRKLKALLRSIICQTYRFRDKNLPYFFATREGKKTEALKKVFEHSPPTSHRASYFLWWKETRQPYIRLKIVEISYIDLGWVDRMGIRNTRMFLNIEYSLITTTNKYVIFNV